jgi:hypothetical protein
MTPHTFSLRVSVRRDGVRFVAHSGSPRSFSPRDDKVSGGDRERFGYIAIFDIARRERQRTTRQSTEYNRHVRTMRFASRFTVDRFELRPRDDKNCKMEYSAWTVNTEKNFVLNILLFDI